MGRVTFKTQKNCEDCGVDMGYVHPKKRFCRECRTKRNRVTTAAYHKRKAEEKQKEIEALNGKCKNCGKKFERTSNNQIYCCTKCGTDYRNKKPKDNTKVKNASKAISPKPKTDWAAIVNKCRELNMSYGEAVARGLLDEHEN